MDIEETTKNVTTSENIPEKQHSIPNDEINAMNPAVEQQDGIIGKNFNQLIADETTEEIGTDKNESINEIVNVISSDKNITQYSRTTTVGCVEGDEETETNVQKSIRTIETVNVNGKTEANETITNATTLTTTTTTTFPDKVSNTHINNNTNINNVGEDIDSEIVYTQPPHQTTSVSTTCSTSLNNSPTIRYSDLAEKQKHCDEIVKPLQQQEHDECELKLQQQILQYEQQLEQLKAALQQKDNMITLFQRENAILEKEKEAVR